MTGRAIFTVACSKFGCLWQGSSYDRAEAEKWGEQHRHAGGDVDIYEEADDDFR